MELRSFNVARIANVCIRCRIKDDCSFNKEALEQNKEDIRSMLDQLDWQENNMPLFMTAIRKDGELWTPFLQVAEYLIILGAAIGYLSFEKPLSRTTIIRRLNNED